MLIKVKPREIEMEKKTMSIYQRPYHGESQSREELHENFEKQMDADVIKIAQFDLAKLIDLSFTRMPLFGLVWTIHTSTPPPYQNFSSPTFE